MAVRLSDQIIKRLGIGIDPANITYPDTRLTSWADGGAFIYGEGTTNEDIAVGIRFVNKDITRNVSQSAAFIYAYNTHLDFLAEDPRINLQMHAGGSLFLTSGASSGAVYFDKTPTDDQKIYILARTSVYLEANRKGIYIDSNGHVLPSTNEAKISSTINLGAVDATFSTLYFTGTLYQKMDGDTSNYKKAITWQNPTVTTQSQPAQIGWHNTGETIALVPYAQSVSPWNRSVGLSIGKTTLMYNNHPVVLGTSTAQTSRLVYVNDAATKYGIAYYSETNTVTSTGAGTNEYVLRSTGTAAPAWSNEYTAHELVHYSNQATDRWYYVTTDITVTAETWVYGTIEGLRGTGTGSGRVTFQIHTNSSKILDYVWFDDKNLLLQNEFRAHLDADFKLYYSFRVNARYGRLRIRTYVNNGASYHNCARTVTQNTAPATFSSTVSGWREQNFYFPANEIYWGGLWKPTINSSVVYNTTDGSIGIPAFKHTNYHFGTNSFGLPDTAIDIEVTTNGSTWTTGTSAFYTAARKRNLFNHNETQIPVGNLAAFDYWNNTAGTAFTASDGNTHYAAPVSANYGVRVVVDFTRCGRRFYFNVFEVYWRAYIHTCQCTIESYNQNTDTWTTIWTGSYANSDTRRFYHLGRNGYVGGTRTSNTTDVNKIRVTMLVTTLVTTSTSDNRRYAPAIAAINIYGIGMPGNYNNTERRFAVEMARHGQPIYVTNYDAFGAARIPTGELYIGDDLFNTAANTEKWSTLYIGNGADIAAQNTHSQGRIYLYSAATKAHIIRGTSTTADYTHYFPNSTGWIVTGGNGTSTGIGDSTHPVYLDTAGVLQQCGDISVHQDATTTSAWRKVLLTGGDTYAAWNTAVTNRSNSYVYQSVQVSVQPSTNTLMASNLTAGAGYLKSTLNGNTITIGSTNGNWGHITNSKDVPFYFNKKVHADGGFQVYNTQFKLDSTGCTVPYLIVMAQNATTDGGEIQLARPSNYTSAAHVYLDSRYSANAVAGTSFRIHDGTNVRLQMNMSTGNTEITGEYVTTKSTSYRMINNNRSVFWHWNGSDKLFYLMFTAANDPYGSWTTGRAMYVNAETYYSYFTRAYGAVWNDYAEFRACTTIEPGRVVIEQANGIMKLCNQRMVGGARVVSDTYGFAIGETSQYKTPIAVSGRVLVYPYQNRELYELGAAVCSAPNGTVDIMTREEIRLFPDRIIGTVSEIPNYNTWYCGQENHPEEVEVNGRIWIYVR